jgi:hypothetical protein
MLEKMTENSPMKTKKNWTSPKLAVIDLNSAANTTIHTRGDGPGTKKS